MTAAKEKTPKGENVTYQGKPVTSIRDAVTGDPGFKGDDKNDQAVIRVADSDEDMTVLRSELEPA